MNPLIFLLLAGAVVAVAANSQSASSSKDDELLASAQKMVLLFDLYTSQSRANLDDDEILALARLNARAKGIALLDDSGILAIAKSKVPSQQLDAFGKVQGMPIPEALSFYRCAFFLPPGAAQSQDGADDSNRPVPDIYSAWAGEARLICEDGGFGDACHKGYFQDWFGRRYGAYHDSDSDLEAIGSGFLSDLKAVWNAAGSQLMSYIAGMASNFPGVGTVVAVGVTFLSEVGKGASFENAALSGARAAVPSALQGAYDIGVGLATTGNLDVEQALTVAMAAAISQGVIDGEVIAKYNTIKKAYEDAKSAGEDIDAGLGTLGTAVNVAT